MKVKDLIKYLEKENPEAVVEVIQYCGGYTCCADYDKVTEIESTPTLIKLT